MHTLPQSLADPEHTVAQTLDFVVQQACTHLQAQQVWLFGSRARGTARRFSDIDIAVLAPASTLQWGLFATTVEDEAPTLLQMDLVDMARCALMLRTAILSDGILIV